MTMSRLVRARDYRAMDDSQLMRLFQQNSERAATELHRRYNHLMRRICGRILRNNDDADDAVQLAWLHLLNYRQSYRFDAAPSTWIYRVTHNAALQVLKRRRWLLPLECWREAIDVPVGLHRPDDPEELFVIKRRSERVHAQLAKLGPKHQDLAFRYFVDGETLQECAKALGLSEPAAKGRIRLARTQLARRLHT